MCVLFVLQDLITIIILVPEKKKKKKKIKNILTDRYAIITP